MELTTQCPRCKHKFIAKIADLQRRKGFIRCKQCAYIFDGFEEVVPDDSSHRADVVPIQDTSTLEPSAASANLAPHPTVSEPEAVPHVIRSNRQHFIATGDNHTTSLDLSAYDHFNSDELTEPSFTDEPSDLSLEPDPELSEENIDGSDFEDESFYVSDNALSEGYLASASAHADSLQPIDEPVLSDRRQNFYQRPRVSLARRGVHIFWSALALFLIAILIVQLLYVFRNQIANQLPVTRPVLESMCTRLACEVSYERRINHIKVVSSSLQLQAKVGTANDIYNLRIRLRNDYKRAQEWPTLIITFTDISTAVISRIELPPQRYLSPEQQSQPFGPFDELEFNLPVDPRAKRINGYKIDKYYS